MTEDRLTCRDQTRPRPPPAPRRNHRNARTRAERSKRSRWKRRTSRNFEPFYRFRVYQAALHCQPRETRTESCKPSFYKRSNESRRLAADSRPAFGIASLRHTPLSLPGTGVSLGTSPSEIPDLPTRCHLLMRDCGPTAGIPTRSSGSPRLPRRSPAPPTHAAAAGVEARFPERESRRLFFPTPQHPSPLACPAGARLIGASRDRSPRRQVAERSGKVPAVAPG